MTTRVETSRGPGSSGGASPRSGVPLLSARNITKTYGSGSSRFQALRGVSIDIHPAESVAIVGKSGSGKSTLMHLLALLDRPDGGTLLVQGQDAQSLSAAEVNRLRNQTFGFVFQQFFMIPNATVLDNVILPLKIAGVSGRQRRERGMEVLDQVELADKAGNLATNLSGGQKQRMVIARALVNHPKIIFADEPTGNLDSITGQVIEDLLFSLKERDGISLVVVTHDEDLAERCDRRLYMRDGLIVEASVSAGEVVEAAR